MNTLPLTVFQERLWFEWQSNPSSSSYNVVLRFDLHGSLDKILLQKAVNEVVNRHEILRTSFSNSGGEGVQVVHHSALYRFELLDLSDRKAELNTALTQYLLQPFPTGKECPHRYILIKVEGDFHIFALSWHHIIVDAKSMQLFLEELSLTYNALLHNNTALISSTDVPMTSILDKEKLFLDSTELKEGLDYWSSKLINAQFFTQLFGKSRSIRQSVNSNRKVLELSQEVSAELISLSDQHKISIFAIMSALLAICLNRFTLEEDLIIGYSADVRDKDLEKKMGFFVNNLMIRTNIDSTMTIVEVVKQIAEARKKDKAHQNVPLPFILKKLRTSGQYTEDPLPNIWINQYTALSYSINLDKINTIPVLVEDIESQHDFILSFNAHDVINAEISYNSAKFNREYIDSFCECFVKVAKAFSRNPYEKVGEVILTKLSPPQIKITFRDKNILDSFEECVNLYPNNIAVYTSQEKCTYKELNDKSNIAAAYLSNIGVNRGDIVCISALSSPMMIATILGIIKCGASYVAIDPDLPIERIQFIVYDTNSKYFITEQDLCSRFSNIKIKTLIPLESLISPDSVSEKNYYTKLSKEDLAYIVYTSGSTGTPKGVMVNHGSLTNLIEIAKCDLGMLPSDKCLQFSSISFDSFVWEWVPTLAIGAALYLLNLKTGSSKMEYLLAVSPDIDVTIATLPPSVISALDKNQAFKSLRILVSAGETCTQEIIDNWKNNVKFINGYGPTEGTVCTTLFTTQGEYPAATIGKPVSNVYIYLLNSFLSPVPIGAVGEIYIGGENLARGYLNENPIDQKSFLYFNNFTPKLMSPGIRLYRTGDLAIYLPDGNIQYAGRADNQVKIRGNRVELSEIENQMLMIDNIQNVVVLVYERDNTKALVAFLVFKQTQDVHDDVIEKIKLHISQNLPSYMLPNRFIKVTNIPLTITGKIDNKKLLSLVDLTLDKISEVQRGEELSANEQILIDIWKDVLNLKEINVNDNYFELGGDSILSIKIVTLAKQKGIDFSVADLFEFSTVKSLIASIKLSNSTTNVNNDPFSLLNEEDKQKLGL